MLYSDVVIIGGGLSGVGMGCQLQRQLQSTDYVIYDRAAELGGAWAANKYPGCGVDIPGVLYSFSWFPNPDFSCIYPRQEEILAYIHRVAFAYGVTQRAKLRTEWKGAKWIESTNTWHVYLHDLNTRQDFVHETKILISAVGGYTNPKIPNIPGLELFDGTVAHTAAWNQKHDLRGLNVAVIGNGCSGSQVVPALLGDANTVTHFIRSPQHYIPMKLKNYRLGSKLRYLFSHLPIALRLFRWVTFWTLDTALDQFYNDFNGKRARENSLLNSQKFIEENAPETYWPLLSPPYDLGCRRRILDNGYIRSLHSPKLRLVNDPISLVSAKSVKTYSEEHHVDFIVLATGFEFTQWRADSVIGRKGKSLQEHWDSLGGITAYKTVAMHGFPNMFYLLGPNSGSGHTSVLFAIECAIDLTVRLIRSLLEAEASNIEVCQEAEIEWCDTIQSALRNTVLSQACANQYTDPISGWNFFSYPFSSLRFWIGTRFPGTSQWIYKRP